MSTLTDLFREAPHPLLIPYAVGGYPDLPSCSAVLASYMEGGSRLLEIGIPFSDPLADGPVIQAASQVALRAGVRPSHVLDLAGEVAERGVGVVLLSYLNTILAFGPDRFFATCAERGVLGVVVPDVPVEEAGDLQATAGGRGVDVVLLAAPTSTDERLARIAANASGFIYCVSTTGVTGARASLRADLPDFVARLRRYTALPLAVGFGVSTPEQAAAVAAYADGVIVGSALVGMVPRDGDLGASLQAVRSFLEQAGRAVASTEAPTG
jgi:tryptophan synthase alpha chain